MKDNFCSGTLYRKVSQVLNKKLLSSNIDIVALYHQMINGCSDEKIIRSSDFFISINDVFGYGALLLNKELENLGIDLPIYFGDENSNKRVMIVAMDAKRNGQSHNKISIGSVFSLDEKNARETNRNDYWNFIEPMTHNTFVYLTDIFKIYYETYSDNNGKKTKLLSNKDKEYIDKKSHSYLTNKSILELEIQLVKPDTIISLGHESAHALKMIQSIDTNDLEVTQNGIRYLFMPHISRTVTQSIPTIANLFITMGKLKNDSEMIQLGEMIRKAKDKLYKQ